MLQRTKLTLSLAPYSTPARVAWSAGILCIIAASFVAASGFSALLGSALGLVMVAIAAIDARRFVIPDQLVIAGLVLGVINVATAPEQAGLGFWESLLRVFLLGALFFGFRLGYRYVRQREGMGLGDVKLAAVAGLWLSWMGAALAIDIAALSALAAVLIGMLRGRKITGQTRIPFGLFFAPSIWFAWLIEATSLHLAV